MNNKLIYLDNVHHYKSGHARLTDLIFSVDAIHAVLPWDIHHDENGTNGYLLVIKNYLGNLEPYTITAKQFDIIRHTFNPTNQVVLF